MTRIAEELVELSLYFRYCDELGDAMTHKLNKSLNLRRLLISAETVNSDFA